MRVRRTLASPEARLARRILHDHGHPDAHVYRLEPGKLSTEVAVTVPAPVPDPERPGLRVARTAHLWASGKVEVTDGW